MNKCELRNTTNRLVSIQGNSRKTFHIGPKSSIVSDEVEFRNLAMLKKLVTKGVLSIKDYKEKDSKAKNKSEVSRETSTEDNKSTKKNKKNK